MKNLTIINGSACSHAPVPKKSDYVRVRFKRSGSVERIHRSFVDFYKSIGAITVLGGR